MKKTFIIFIILIVTLTSIFASKPVSLSFGVDYDSVTDENGDTINLLGVNVTPDFVFGKWGIGLSVPLRFALGGSDGFRFFQEDYIPEIEEGDNLLNKANKYFELYVPLFNYVSYGQKGENLYAIVGKVEDFTIGTGMFVNHYSNKRLLPQTKISGLELDIDGSLFGFPYVGLETFTSDIVNLNIVGGRFYIKPFAFLTIPVISTIQIGASYVVDRNINQHEMYQASTLSEGEVAVIPDEIPKMYGADVLIPIVNSDFFAFESYLDLGYQKLTSEEDSLSDAARVGVKGHLLSILHYQIDVTKPLSNNLYSPEYFSRNYDRDPAISYENSMNMDDYFLNGRADFSLLEDKILFGAQLTGNVVSNGGNFGIDNPSLYANLKISEGLIPNFGLEAYYKKFNIDGSTINTFFNDVITLTRNSQIEAVISFKYGIVKTTMGYVIDFDENGNSSSSATQVGASVSVF
ncbi:MAG: hypothetical protein WC162_11100 [Sphaerochaetaceae bacterium]